MPSSASIAFLTVFRETCNRRAISRTDCRCTKYARLIRPIVSTVVILRLVVSPNSQRTWMTRVWSPIRRRSPSQVGTNCTPIHTSVTGFDGRISFDTSKPDGAPRKLLDVTRLSSLGWTASTSLREGIEQTYSWFLANRHNLRGT